MSKWTREAIDTVLAMYNNHTYSEISKALKKKHGVEKSVNAIRKCYERHSLPIYDMSEKPKVLLFDIETAPMLGYIWKLWDNNVSLNQLQNDWYILSWSAKWLGDDKILYMDQRNAKDIEDDKKILKELWKLLDEADIVVGQNSKSFDHKKVNARFILNGMKPPSTYRQIDTRLLARKHFGFTSNKLEYLSGKLCKDYKKSKHTKFSGFELWKECIAGNLNAWEEMEEYNKLDVLSLEELYLKLIPWDNSINFSIYGNGSDPVCSCGNKEFKKSGFYFTNSCKYQKYKCTKCGSEIRDKKNLKKVSYTGTTR